MLSDFTDMDDEASHTRADGSQRKAEKLTSIVQALCTIRDKLAAMRTSGLNNTTKADILATLHEAINMAANQERENGTEWNLAPESNAYDRCISNIEKDVKEIKEAILNNAAAKPKTWAQIASGPSMGVPEIRLEVAIRERLKKARKERAKTEVTITLREASRDICQHIEQMQEKAIAETLQQGIRDRFTSSGKADVKIRGVRKVSKYILKVLCATEKDASAIQQLK